MRVVGTGGGSKGAFWNRIKADVLNAPYVTLERTEGAVLGNAILAAYGVGDISDIRKTVNDWIKIKERFDPNPKNNAVYMKIYNMREQILNGPLYQIFDMLSELHKIELPEK